MSTSEDTNAFPGTQYPVYLGFWINWSRGRVMGSTLTLRQSDANFLIVFIAFFVAFIATRFWRILCFVLHRFYSEPNPQDAIYHQRQAILRNSSSPEYGMWLLFRLLLAGRRSKSPFRPAFAALCALLCIGAFTIAGGFSSRISTAVGNEVLLQSSNCGYGSLRSWARSPYYPSDPYLAETLNNAANYAQQCYPNDTTGLLDCGRFITPRIPGTLNMTADCPFKNDMCRTSSSNLRLDTGYVDSHIDLGLNAPENDRILWRNVVHCAPLVTKGFTSHNVTALGNLTFYHYGTTSGLPRNVTYSAESVEAQVARFISPDMAVTTANYRIE